MPLALVGYDLDSECRLAQMHVRLGLVEVASSRQIVVAQVER